MSTETRGYLFFSPLLLLLSLKTDVIFLSVWTLKGEGGRRTQRKGKWETGGV